MRMKREKLHPSSYLHQMQRRTEHVRLRNVPFQHVFKYQECIIKHVWAPVEIKPVTLVYMHSRNKVTERNQVKRGNLRTCFYALQ